MLINPELLSDLEAIKAPLARFMAARKALVEKLATAESHIQNTPTMGDPYVAQELQKAAYLIGQIVLDVLPNTVYPYSKAPGSGAVDKSKAIIKALLERKAE